MLGELQAAWQRGTRGEGGIPLTPLVMPEEK